MGPETDTMVQFMGPDTDIIGEIIFIIYSLAMLQSDDDTTLFWEIEADIKNDDVICMKIVQYCHCLSHLYFVLMVLSTAEEEEIILHTLYRNDNKFHWISCFQRI